MREDFEEMGVSVQVLSPNDPDYIHKLKVCGCCQWPCGITQRHGCAQDVLRSFGVVIANTIMRAEVVEACAALKVRHMWIVHEAWPKDEFEYYAKEVACVDGPVWEQRLTPSFPLHARCSLCLTWMALESSELLRWQTS